MKYFSNKAVVLTVLKKYDECLETLETALKKYSYSKQDPIQLAILFSRKARVLELQGHFKEAITFFKKSLELKPDPFNSQHLFMLHEKMRNLEM